MKEEERSRRRRGQRSEACSVAAAMPRVIRVAKYPSP